MAGSKKTRSRKTFDLTQNRTAQPVKKQMSRIQTAFSQTLRATNVPALERIATDPNLVEHYFCSRPLFQAMLGDTLALFDRAFRLSLTSLIADDLTVSMLGTGSIYPGLWDRFNVQSVLMAIVTVTSPEDAPEVVALNANLTYNTPVTTDTVANYPEGSWLPFPDYNPNRLYQFCTVVHNTAIHLITNEIMSKVPAAKMTVVSDTRAARYGRELSAMLREANGALEESKLAETLEDQAKEAIAAIERPFLGYVTAMLTECGLGPAVIRLLLDNVNAKAVYNTDTTKGKTLTTFIHPWMQLDYHLSNKDDSMNKVTFSANTNDLYVLSLTPTDDMPEPKAVQQRVGKALVRFIDNLTAYAMNLAIDKEAELVAVEPVDGPEADAETADI